MSAPAMQRGLIPVGGFDPTGEEEIKKLNRLLRSGPHAVGTSKRDLPKLVGANNEEMPLPEPIYELLCTIAPRLMRGELIFLVPEHAVLTTQQAADILGMSRPFLKKLLDQNVIPFHRVGTHRRIRFMDVMAYKERRDEERQEQVDDLLALSEEVGAYK